MLTKNPYNTQYELSSDFIYFDVFRDIPSVVNYSKKINIKKINLANFELIAKNENDRGASYFYINKEKRMVITIYPNGYEILYDRNLPDQTIVDMFKKARCKPPKKLYVLTPCKAEGYRKNKLKVSKPVDVSLNYPYLDHDKIVKSVNEDRCGLHIFTGKPGTGKTTYIKNLIHFSKKSIIYLSTEMSSNLGDSNLNQFFINNKECIFVVEDAEKLLESRATASNDNVAALLNLTDGVMGDVTRSQIILTVNSGLENIDQALLRKGRLLTQQEFLPLSVDESQKVFNSIGKDVKVDRPMTLSEIYYYDGTFVEEKRPKKVGFV